MHVLTEDRPFSRGPKTLYRAAAVISRASCRILEFVTTGRRFRIQAFAALCAAALTLAPAPPAWSVPGDGAPVDAPTLTLAEMGSPAPLAFYGQTGTATLTFPVPPGLIPATLNATVEIPAFVRSGVITVTQDERTITRLELPLVDRGPIVIPLPGVQIADNSVTVTIRSYLLPLEGYCLDPTNPLRLVDGTVTYTGVERTPTAVADFLPPVLRALTIAVPRNPSQAESDAAVRLAASVAAHYGEQNTRVVLAALPDDAAMPTDPSGPLERQIVIKEGPDTGLSLQGGPGIPVLLISGSGAELTNQTRLLATGMSALAVTSKAVVGPLKNSPQLPGNVTTLQELGQPGVTAVALSPQVAIGLDQTRLGRSARDVRVHLKGSYTPVPDGIGAQLVALTGGETIDRWAADANGQIDRWVQIPDRLLRRYTNLNVAVNITGNTGRCGEFQPITLTVDGDSIVQSSPAAPPVPAGFQSMPQAMMPRMQVGLGDDRFADTARAVSIIAALQRLSSLPFDTVVTGAKEALDSDRPAVVIAADGWDHPGITLPARATETGLDIEGFDPAGEPVTLRLDPDAQFGSLQTVYQNNRSILVATSNGAPAQLDGLLRWLDDDPLRWSRLDGAAVVATPDRTPVTVPNSAVAEAAASQGNSHWVWWAAGAGVVVALGAALILLRSRRRRAAG